jgi:AcrR family transcriptional regulator
MPRTTRAPAKPRKSPAARDERPARKAARPAARPPVDDDHRRRLDLDERRDQLLTLGRRIFAERAYDEVSIDDIAEAAGISKGLLYHYFGSKRGFYVAIVRESASRLVDATAIRPDLPPGERAHAGLAAYLDFAEAHSNAFLALLRGGIGHDAEVQELVDATRETILQRMLQNMGLSEPRPVFHLAMRSYVGLVEAATIDWLERRAVDRGTLMRFLLEAIYAIISSAVTLDPGAGLRLDDKAVMEAQAMPRGKR